MQTVEWTDGKLEERLERLDERFGSMERKRHEDREWVKERFDEVDRRLEENREVTIQRFDETNRRFDEVERRFAGVEELKQDMKALQTTFQRGNFALVAAVFGVLIATILKGG